MNVTYFNLISTIVTGLLLVLFVAAVWMMRTSKEINKPIFYTMFVMVIAHAALSLLVTFTAPDTIIDTKAI
jgi:uncharacterized membrane protein